MISLLLLRREELLFGIVGEHSAAFSGLLMIGETERVGGGDGSSESQRASIDMSLMASLVSNSIDLYGTSRALLP